MASQDYVMANPSLSHQQEPKHLEQETRVQTNALRLLHDLYETLSTELEDSESYQRQTVGVVIRSKQTQEHSHPCGPFLCSYCCTEETK